jgi:hypothetical protein
MLNYKLYLAPINVNQKWWRAGLFNLFAALKAIGEPAPTIF